MHVQDLKMDNNNYSSSSSSHQSTSSSSSSEKETAVPANPSPPPPPTIPSSGDGDDEALSPYTLTELAAHGIHRVGSSSSEEREKVKTMFMTGMGSLSAQTAVISVHKNSAEPSHAFQADSAVLARKHHGLSVYADAWLGGPKDQIFGIVQRGFPRHRDGLDSWPVCLSAVNYALDRYNHK